MREDRRACACTYKRAHVCEGVHACAQMYACMCMHACVWGHAGVYDCVRTWACAEHVRVLVCMLTRGSRTDAFCLAPFLHQPEILLFRAPFCNSKSQGRFRSRCQLAAHALSTGRLRSLLPASVCQELVRQASSTKLRLEEQKKVRTRLKVGAIHAHLHVCGRACTCVQNKFVLMCACVRACVCVCVCVHTCTVTPLTRAHTCECAFVCVCACVHACGIVRVWTCAGTGAVCVRVCARVSEDARLRMQARV